MRKIKHFKVHSLKAVIIDNFYSIDDYNHLLDESLHLLNNNLLQSPRYTGSAKDDNGNFMKNNMALFLDEYYVNDRSQSKILTINRKIFTNEVCTELLKSDFFYNYYSKSNHDSSLISYYEDHSYYLQHTDDAIITVLFWLYRSPKSFKGGDLILNGTKKIKCLNNRLVIFPSIIPHEVTAVSIPNHLKNQGNGRFCITNFVYIHSGLHSKL